MSARGADEPFVALDPDALRTLSERCAARAREAFTAAAATPGEPDADPLDDGLAWIERAKQLRHLASRYESFLRSGGATLDERAGQFLRGKQSCSAAELAAACGEPGLTLGHGVAARLLERLGWIRRVGVGGIRFYRTRADAEQ